MKVLTSVLEYGDMVPRNSTCEVGALVVIPELRYYKLITTHNLAKFMPYDRELDFDDGYYRAVLLGFHDRFSNLSSDILYNEAALIKVLNQYTNEFRFRPLDSFDIGRNAWTPLVDSLIRQYSA